MTEDELFDLLGFPPEKDVGDLVRTALGILDILSEGQEAPEDTQGFRAARVLVQECEKPEPALLANAIIINMLLTSTPDTIAATFNVRVAKITQQLHNYVAADGGKITEKPSDYGPEVPMLLLATHIATLEQDTAGMDRKKLGVSFRKAVNMSPVLMTGTHHPALEFRFARAVEYAQDRLELLAEPELYKTAILGTPPKPGLVS